MLQIQSKRFYLDVKQNRRGKFIKVAEVSDLTVRIQEKVAIKILVRLLISICENWNNI